MIPPPLIASDHPDRGLACEWAMQGEMDRVAREAAEAGWREAEINHALLRLAMTRILAADANAETDEAIRQAWLEVRGTKAHCR